MTNTEKKILPPGFEDLVPYVDRWAKPSTNERLATRCQSSMDDIRAFYDAMLIRADDAMAYIDRYSIDALPPDVGRLCQLVLALSQAAVAVEIHEQPIAPGAPYPNGILLERGTAPFG